MIVARRRVGVATVHAGPDRPEPRELRHEAERIDLLQPVGDLTDGERPRAVRAVAVEDAAGVDGDEHALARSRGSPGSACGDVPVSPAATTVGNETPSAPASRKLRSTHHTRSRSVRPVKRSCDSASKISSESAPARRMISISRVVLDRAQRLDESSDRDGVDARVDERPVAGIGKVRLLEADAPSREALADRGQQAPRGLDERDAGDLAPALRVAEVREERRRPVRLDEQRGVRAREPREVADVRLPAEDVRRPRDEQRLVEERGKPLDARSLPLHRGTRAPRGSRPAPCRRSASRRRPRAPRSAAIPRARRCSRGAPRRPGP